MPVPVRQQPCTYGDYLQWDDEGRYEIIEGVVYDMTPAPSTKHQLIVTELMIQIGIQLDREGFCRLLAAPFDVRLPEVDETDEAIETVVQPDISVICDPSKLDERGCRGAPDWIIEIVSPSTTTKDFIRKLVLYEKHSVQEYWIVDPVGEIVTVYQMTEAQRYGRPTEHTREENIESHVIEGLAIDLSKVFRGRPWQP